MKKQIFLLLFSFTFLTFTSCKEDIETSALKYISFEKTEMSLGVSVGTEESREIKIYTTNTTSSDRTINISVIEDESTADPAAYTVSSSVTIPAGTNEGSIDLNFKDIGLDFTASKTVALKFESNDAVAVGEKLILNVTRVCPNEQTELSVVFDGYASENAISIKDSSGNVVFSAGSWADGLGSYSSQICLVPGDYTFTITDSYGDGLSYPANGSVEATYNGTTLVNIVGNFGSGQTVSFTIQ